ncbi:MAG: tetraacyldisaccharide 4'-kinase, partial [Acidobacteriota bacterium]
QVGRTTINDIMQQILADPRKAGDEPFELAHKLLGKAIVIADADRVAAAEWAKRKFGVTAFVLDDAFQHRKAKRDVDIVCIDATDPFDGAEMLPAGRLREPLANLSRADIVVITRANLVDNIETLRSEISDLAPDAHIFAAGNQISGIVGSDEFHANPRRPQSEEKILVKGTRSNEKELRAKRALAFCALGNPENFFQQLRHDGFTVAETEAFRDHHRYFQQDIDKIDAKAGQTGCEVLLTSAKDTVKLKGLTFTFPCFVVEIEMVIDDAEEFIGLI